MQNKGFFQVFHKLVNNGLNDIIKHRELSNSTLVNRLKCYPPQSVNSCSDIHVGEIYKDYPIFDSYDLSDDRKYQNYIFRKGEITPQDMEAAFALCHQGNFCMVHEQIPPSLLHILYYRGDGNYMLLATNK